jgi:uncharacterized protein YwgA
MNLLSQRALVVALAEKLEKKGSWTGETHVQKATYLLSELCGVDFDFDFILYKHGPFSFELRDELSGMQSEGLLESVAPSPRYGPQLLVTPRGKNLEKDFEKTMQRYGESLDWIADTLGSRGVMDLERLATAMWMTREDPGGSIRSRAKALTDVKPHISLKDATESVEEIDGLLRNREADAAK